MAGPSYSGEGGERRDFVQRSKRREKRIAREGALRGRRVFAVSGPADDSVTEKHVLQKDFLNVVGGAPTNGKEVQWTRDADGAMRGYVAARSWNITLWVANLNSGTWTDMPAAHTLFVNGFTGAIKRADLTEFTQCRLKVVTISPGFTGAKLRARYATSGPTTIGNYLQIGSSEVTVTIDGAGTQFLASAWTDLVAGAKGDVYLACTGIDGNGAADPVFTSVDVEFR